MRVKKLGKIIAIMVAIILLIEVTYPITYTYASFLGGITSESRPAPSPPPSSGGGGGGGSSHTPSPPSSTPTPDDDDGSDSSGPPATVYNYVDRYTKIKGNVYEDLGFSDAGTAGADDSRKTIGAKDVLVQLCQGDTVVDSMRTGEDGNYEFEPSPGTYTVKFKFGYVKGETAALQSI